MRLAVLSDLHVEFAPFELPRTGADVVVLAGDVGKGRAHVRPGPVAVQPALT